MSGFVFKKDADVALSAGQGGMKTGVFKVKVVAVGLKTDKSGNPRADFIFEDENGKRALVFGLCIAEKWTTGKENSDYSKWQEFVNVIGMETGAVVAQEVQVSKTKKDTWTVFTECTGKAIQVAIQEELGVYNNAETNDKKLYRTFFIGGHSLAEKTANQPAKQIEHVKANLKPYETKEYKAFKAGGISTAAEDSDVIDNSNIESDDDLI